MSDRGPKVLCWGAGPSGIDLLQHSNLLYTDAQTGITETIKPIHNGCVAFMQRVNCCMQELTRHMKTFPSCIELFRRIIKFEEMATFSNSQTTEVSTAVTITSHNKKCLLTPPEQDVSSSPVDTFANTMSPLRGVLTPTLRFVDRFKPISKTSSRAESKIHCFVAKKYAQQYKNPNRFRLLTMTTQLED
uniref:Uncharacterized protein n=1 Tax=Strigamia maritima TaxID=126957 RepID=T1IQV9_STRMM